jgi:hypothetical protein
MILRGSLRKIALLAAAAAMIVPGTASADTLISHSGTFGPNKLAETATSGEGARCEYGQAAHRLDKVRAVRPYMKAVAGHASQKVAWRAIFQDPNVNFVTLLVTPKVFAFTSDTAWAVFPQQTQTWTADGPGYTVRVLIDEYWYTGNNVTGFVRRRVDFYRYHLEGSSVFTRHSSRCNSILP